MSIYKNRVDFDGETYVRALDLNRLTGQNRRVYLCMLDSKWRTLGEIAIYTGDPEASISARLRDLRKSKFGGFQVNRRRRGEPKDGLWEYQLARSRPAQPEQLRLA